MGDYTLIELPSGERQFVRDASEYGEDVTIIADGIDLQTDPDAELVNGAWVVPLAVQQERAWIAVKAIRELREEGTFDPSGRLLTKATCWTTKGVAQCDDASRNFITGLVVKAGIQGAAFSVSFTMADNTQVPMDAAAIEDFGVQVDDFIEATHKHSLELRAAIGAATTDEDLAAIDLDAGWPT